MLVDAGLPVRGGFTTRDLGDARGRSDLAAVLGLPKVVGVRQVHGREVVEVDATTAGGTDADALVTRTPGIGLVVVAADCMPVLLADPVAGVVGAAHAGRPGLVAGVLQATVAAMRDLGATSIVATVGPCIGGCCYELPEDLADEVARAVPSARSTTTWRTPSIDLRAGAVAVLAAAGVTDVRHVGGCTHEQPETWFSYRRDATTDRHAGVVVLP